MSDRETMQEMHPDVELLFADGFDDAIIGVCDGRICYDKDLMVSILIERDNSMYIHTFHFKDKGSPRKRKRPGPKKSKADRQYELDIYWEWVDRHKKREISQADYADEKNMSPSKMKLLIDSKRQYVKRHIQSACNRMQWSPEIERGIERGI